MPVTAVVGAQWGDEGKGRIVDYLAAEADMVVRFQGGDNAGHTVVNDYGTFALHILPSGIFHPETRCIVGTGTVVFPDALLQELAELEAAGVSTENLWISDRAHLILPVHRQLDGLEEASRGGAKIGTTGRGIGPAYSDKAGRHGLRLGDLLRPDYLRERLANILLRWNRLLASYGAPVLQLDALMAEAETWRARIGDRIVDTLPLVQDAVRNDARIVLEGQLGAMRDLDWGIYPYVTSSNPISGGACAGAGLPPSAVHDVLGIVKAYSTAVGAGPFPVELTGPDGDRLRDAGNEYGATTGRPRRCGWFDALAVRHSSWLNGFTGLAVTKLDVLDDMEELSLCVAYELDGKRVEHLPYTADLDRVRPVYETWPGWQSSTTDARRWEDLPENAQRYLERIAEIVGVSIRFVSVGPQRDALIVR